MGRARCRGACLHQRPRADGRHVSVRAPNVRDDGLLGDRADQSRRVADRTRLQRDLAGGRQDRVLDDSRGRRDNQRADSSRAHLRSGLDCADEGRGRDRHRGGRPQPRRARDPSRARRRDPHVPHADRDRQRQSCASRRRSGRFGTVGRSSLRRWHGLSALPHDQLQASSRAREIARPLLRRPRTRIGRDNWAVERVALRSARRAVVGDADRRLLGR